MPKTDEIDKHIKDYLRGYFDKRIEARIAQLTYKSKVDNLGIKTSYFGGSEQERAVLMKEKIDEDEVILKYRYEIEQIENWFSLYPEAKKISIMRWKDDCQQWEIEQSLNMSRSTILRRYNEFKNEIRESGYFDV